MELNSINNSLAAPKENLKLEIPVNHDQNLDLQQPISIEEKLKFITDKKLAHQSSYRLDTRVEDQEMMDNKDAKYKNPEPKSIHYQAPQPYAFEHSEARFDIENPRTKISDLIQFFNNDVESGDQIYAHKEFHIDSQTGKKVTRIKQDQEILRLLRVESKLLRQYMSHTYNIQVEIDPQTGYITQFPFRQRWLRGEEYGFLCRHYYAYSKLIGLFGIKDSDHPEEIYHQPKCKLIFHFIITLL